ncbi:MAG: PHB depolymerase family esterase [Burkholderiales bacterium]
MPPDLQQMMLEATRLTRLGDIAAATTLIREALRDAEGPAAGGYPAGSGPAPASGPDLRRAADGAPAADAAAVIDVVAREIGSRPSPSDSPQPAESEPRRPQADGGPDGGRFVSGSFAHRSAGTRDYKLYLPPQALQQNAPLPLVVMLHGCTQDPDDFARGTAMNEAAAAQGFFVLYPAQSQQMNPQRCWNWFKHSHQERGRGEPALLADLTRDVIANYAIDPERVYVAGLSAGGAMAAILGQTYPDVFAAVGVHSGLAAGAANDLPSAFAAMQGSGSGMPPEASGMPTIVFHGDADSTVHPSNAEQVIAASIGKGSVLRPEAVPSSQGRRTTRRVHRDAAGKATAELWTVHGAPHAWAGGQAQGTYTDGAGPDATAEMVRFFNEHRRRRPN